MSDKLEKPRVEQAPEQQEGGNLDRKEEEMRARNEARLARMGLGLQTDAPATEKLDAAGNVLLDAQDDYFANHIASITSEDRIAKLEELQTEAFGGSRSGFEGNIKILSETAANMNSPLAGRSMLVGKFNGRYRISAPNIARMRKVLPDAETLIKMPDGAQKQFYAEYDRMLTDLENLAPADKASFEAEVKRRGLSLPEKQMNYALKNFGLIGLGIIAAFLTIASISQKKLSWGAIASVGLLAYLTNPKLFASVPEKMKDKLAIFKNDAFDRHLPSLTPELADEVFHMGKLEISQFRKHVEQKKSRATPLTDQDLEMLTGLSDTSKNILKSMPAQDAHDIILLLAERSGSDQASVEAQEVIKSAISNNANAAQLGRDVDQVAKAATQAKKATPSS